MIDEFAVTYKCLAHPMRKQRGSELEANLQEKGDAAGLVLNGASLLLLCTKAAKALFGFTVISVFLPEYPHVQQHRLKQVFPSYQSSD
jgi:hypothetical protein